MLVEKTERIVVLEYFENFSLSPGHNLVDYSRYRTNMEYNSKDHMQTSQGDLMADVMAYNCHADHL